MSFPDIRKRFFLFAVPTFLLLTCALPHLEQGDFRTDMGRYAAVALQMWDRGDLLYSYLHPGVNYFNKPPLVLWIHGLVLNITGVSLVAARMPSVFAALGCVITLVVTVRLYGSRSSAYVAGIVLSLTYEFFRRSREISLDLWQLFFMLLSVYLFMTGLKRCQNLWLFMAGIPIGLALLCKPLVALVIPVIFGLFLLFRRDFYRLPLLIGTLVLALVVALPWHIVMYMLHGPAFLEQYLGYEVVGRILGITVNRGGGLFYYMQIIGKTYWPWAVFSLAGLYFLVRGRGAARRREGVFFALVWLVVWSGVLSAIPDKAPRYAIMLYPMMAWVTAFGITLLPWKVLRRVYCHSAMTISVLSIFTLIVLSLSPIKIHKPPNPSWVAWFNWMESAGKTPSDIWEVHIASNESSKFYLKYRAWANRAVDPAGNPTGNVPPGAVVLYGPESSFTPGAGELTLFEHNGLRATLLNTHEWKPRIRHDT